MDFINDSIHGFKDVVIWPFNVKRPILNEQIYQEQISCKSNNFLRSINTFLILKAIAFTISVNFYPLWCLFLHSLFVSSCIRKTSLTHYAEYFSFISVFTARRHASAVYAVAVCLSVCHKSH